MGVTVQLERETANAELAGLNKTLHTRSLHEEVRSLWDHMNGGKDDLLYAGPFEQ